MGASRHRLFLPFKDELLPIPTDTDRYRPPVSAPKVARRLFSSFTLVLFFLSLKILEILRERDILVEQIRLYLGCVAMAQNRVYKMMLDLTGIGILIVV